MAYQWCSFVDPKKPEGERFLGVIILEAKDVIDAVEQCWARRINPGGEVACFPLDAKPPDHYLYRLLDKSAVAALEEEMSPA